MFKQYPGRNQRSRGNNVKHMLRICFLFAICFWLVYHVKHSHDKKELFDEADTNIILTKQSNSDVLKLGRKDLNPKLEERLTAEEKPTEKTGDVETAGEQENNKHEEGGEEEKDLETEEKDDERREGGQDEIDHDNEENSGEKFDREGVMEDEKDAEDGITEGNSEKEVEDGNSHGDDENSSVDEDVEDETSRGTHEAREENYKGDDASSAVTHEDQIFTDEVALGNSNELSLGNIQSEHLAHNAEISADSRVERREMAENRSPTDTNVHGEDNYLESATEEGTAFGDVSGLQMNALNQGKKPINSSNAEVVSDDEVSSETGNFGSSSVEASDGDKINVPFILENSGSNEAEDDNFANEVDSDSVDKTSPMDNSHLDSEIPDEVQQDPVDSSDPLAGVSDKDVKTDMETLPVILIEGSNTEGKAIE